ncbi:uncharacterized protein LOC131657969 [Vicia villosa]|uniref:uncharacterized protein LOC131657969 n=1 Tax=Vicia villosa TaxID=3911 RepID=UPI00273CC4CD|nr:uncharacterized protein LOC131657969 [Vicia villosa]
MEDSSNCDKACDGETGGMILNEMTTVPKCDLQPLNIDSFFCSDCDVTSVVSMKEDCGSPMSSRVSDPETDIKAVTSCHVMPEEFLQDVDLEGNYENQFVAVENNDDDFSWEMDNRSYEELLKKFIEKEEELRVSNFKFQLSEQEIIGLKVKVEKSESQISDMHEKLELKEYELNEQKELLNKEIFKLMTHIKKSESHLDNVLEELMVNKGQLFMMHEKLNLKNVELDNVHGELNLKNVELDNVRKELELKASQFDNVCEELKLESDELNEQKKKELDNKSSMTLELQYRIKEEKENTAILKSKLESLVRINEENDINHQEELRKLISTMFDLHVKSFWKKEELHSDIASLSKQKEQLTSKLEYYESRNKALEQGYEAEKLKQKKLHSAQLMALHNGISYLKKKLGDRINDVEQNRTV